MLVIFCYRCLSRHFKFTLQDEVNARLVYQTPLGEYSLPMQVLLQLHCLVKSIKNA